MSCQRTQGFLAKKGTTVAETVDAAKTPLEPGDLPGLLRGIDHLYVAKGAKTLHFDLRSSRPSEPELRSLLIGRTGKLRAPALRRGRTMVVGFNDGALETLV